MTPSGDTRCYSVQVRWIYLASAPPELEVSWVIWLDIVSQIGDCISRPALFWDKSFRQSSNLLSHSIPNECREIDSHTQWFRDDVTSPSPWSVDSAISHLVSFLRRYQVTKFADTDWAGKSMKTKNVFNVEKKKLKNTNKMSMFEFPLFSCPD